MFVDEAILIIVAAAVVIVISYRVSLSTGITAFLALVEQVLDLLLRMSSIVILGAIVRQTSVL